MTETTTIMLRRETRDRLKGLGKKGETYDDILTRLLDAYARAQSEAPRRRGLVAFEEIRDRDVGPR